MLPFVPAAPSSGELYGREDRDPSPSPNPSLKQATLDEMSFPRDDPDAKTQHIKPEGSNNPDAYPVQVNDYIQCGSFTPHISTLQSAQLANNCRLVATPGRAIHRCAYACCCQTLHASVEYVLHTPVEVRRFLHSGFMSTVASIVLAFMDAAFALILIICEAFAVVTWVSVHRERVYTACQLQPTTVAT